MATKATTKPAAAKDAAKTEEEVPQKISAKEIDPNQYVVVRNGFHGKLVYESPRTKELFTWNEFGDEQEMELRELKGVKNVSKDFFANNWFMFDDEWVVDYLGVRQYYKNATSIEHYDDIFKKSPAELKVAVGEMTSGQRNNLIFRAHELIANGGIDSIKTIRVLEEALGVDLVEK